MDEKLKPHKYEKHSKIEKKVGEFMKMSENINRGYLGVPSITNT